MWIYIQSEPWHWTVGFYDPSGKFVPESDWESTDKAAARIHYLNGGGSERYDESEFIYCGNCFTKHTLDSKCAPIP